MSLEMMDMFSDGVLDLRKYKMEYIPERAFEGNTDIKEVYFPKTLEFVGEDSFKGCTSLEVFSLEDCSRLKGVHRTALDGATNLKTLIANNGRYAYSVKDFLNY